MLKGLVHRICPSELVSSRWTSVPQMPSRNIRIDSSPTPGAGTGRDSSRTRGAFQPVRLSEPSVAVHGSARKTMAAVV